MIFTVFLRKNKKLAKRVKKTNATSAFPIREKKDIKQKPWKKKNSSSPESHSMHAIRMYMQFILCWESEKKNASLALYTRSFIQSIRGCLGLRKKKKNSFLASALSVYIRSKTERVFQWKIPRSLYVSAKQRKSATNAIKLMDSPCFDARRYPWEIFCY